MVGVAVSYRTLLGGVLFPLPVSQSQSIKLFPFTLSFSRRFLVLTMTPSTTRPERSLASRITPQPKVPRHSRAHYSGPVFLILSNIAPGTTAAEISTALADFWGLVHCILHAVDTSRAILLFEDYRFAEAAQTHLHHAHADGNLLAARLLTEEENDALSLVARTVDMENRQASREWRTPAITQPASSEWF